MILRKGNCLNHNLLYHNARLGTSNVKTGRQALLSRNNIELFPYLNPGLTSTNQFSVGPYLIIIHQLEKDEENLLGK